MIRIRLVCVAVKERDNSFSTLSNRIVVEGQSSCDRFPDGNICIYMENFIVDDLSHKYTS